MSEAFHAAPRIGIGWDRHRMQAGRPCVLGGVRLECPVGPAGHSDGDVLLHALADALLGAAGLDDLGTLFPDTDPRYAGAASTELLHAVLERVAAAGLRPACVDVVVVCDRPRLAPARARIRGQLAGWLRLPLERVNLKGKTSEGAATVEAVEAMAVAALVPL
ncbi:MAG: 2-C-methyl-D-erythritol 2,4-cyclodiphosphate synthase [Planctomycetota bacterium]|nr:MAG: 2-C-methyl-D-erythritol 2,4-cyclodiphosphate synthase [Planctomycetota bacterium]